MPIPLDPRKKPADIKVHLPEVLGKFGIAFDPSALSVIDVFQHGATVQLVNG